ncbi:MAG: ATP-binding protein [Anaeromyxobacteraceae bacterium]
MEAALQEEPDVAQRKLHLARELALPFEAVTQTFAILAMRGVGKTYTASVLAEELAKAGLPYAVLDPTGAWWGLRASADGKGEGYPVTILGGDHGDVPLEEGAGKVIAQLLADEAPTLVLDLAHLSKSAMRRFVADFAEELYRKNRRPLHIIIDEADAFAPQKPRSDELRMLGAIDEIVRRGRIRGLGCTLVTQRSAVLNKDVLTQMEVLVALRTAHPRDRAPVLEWMKVHATEEQLAEVTETLATLPKGDAWVMSAGWLDLFKRVHIRERETFNSSATPEAGQRRIEPKKLADVDLKLLQERMAATIERAKATDPKLLARRVAELEAELKKARAATPAPAAAKRETKVVEKPVLKDAHLSKLETVLGRAEAMQLRHVESMNGLADALHAVRASLELLRRQPAAAPPGAAPRPMERRVAAPPSPRRASTNGADTDAPLGTGERAVLTAIAQHSDGVDREQLTVLTGYKRATRNTYLQRLGARGLIVLQGDRFFATDAGLTVLGPDFEPLPTGPALLERWRRELPSGERAVLEVAVASYPEPVDRERITELTGYQRATRNTYLQRLGARKLVEDAGRGLVRASETLFAG